jgi:hypothetical protein
MENKEEPTEYDHMSTTTSTTTNIVIVPRQLAIFGFVMDLLFLLASWHFGFLVAKNQHTIANCAVKINLLTRVLLLTFSTIATCLTVTLLCISFHDFQFGHLLFLGVFV